MRRCKHAVYAKHIVFIYTFVFHRNYSKLLLALLRMTNSENLMHPSNEQPTTAAQNEKKKNTETNNEPDWKTSVIRNLRSEDEQKNYFKMRKWRSCAHALGYDMMQEAAWQRHWQLFPLLVNEFLSIVVVGSSFFFIVIRSFILAHSLCQWLKHVGNNICQDMFCQQSKVKATLNKATEIHRKKRTK